MFQVALVELDLIDRSGAATGMNIASTNSSGSSVNTNSISGGVIIAFGVCTTLLVSVHLLALMMSTCILPYIEAACESEQTMPGYDSLHVRMRWYIELAWFFSTVLGLLLFLLEIGIVFWIKFISPWNSGASYVTTAMLVPVFIVFIWFTYTFYKKLTLHNYETTKRRLDDIDYEYCSRLNELESVTVTTPSVQDDKMSRANDL